MAWKITEIPDEAPKGPGCGGCAQIIGAIILLLFILFVVANK